MRFLCPDCDHEFVISVSDSAPVPRDPASPLTGKSLRSVLDFMRTVEPGRHTSASLYERYQQFDGPDLTMNAFARALKRNGAQPYRTSSERGYGIPEIPADAQPGKVARYVTEHALTAGPGLVEGYGEVRALSPSGKPYVTHRLDKDDNRIPVEKPQWVIDEEEAAVKPVFVDDYPVPSFVGPL